MIRRSIWTLVLVLGLTAIGCSDDEDSDDGGGPDTSVTDTSDDDTATGDTGGGGDTSDPPDDSEDGTSRGDTVAKDAATDTSSEDGSGNDTQGGGDTTVGDTSYSISDQRLQGTFNGESWEYSFAEASESNFEDDSFDFQIFAGTGSECDGFDTPTEDDDRYLNGQMPSTAGVYELGTSQTVTFTWDENGDGSLDNAFAEEGVLVIEEVTQNKITGRMYAYIDDDNVVEGNFEMGRCSIL